MKAIVFERDQQLRLRDIPTPRPGAGEVLVRVEAAGICGTDIHILRGEFPAACPGVLGHEFAGTVADVGAGVSSVAVGDLVAVEPHIYCGICRYCQDGREYLCPTRRAFGVHLPGGFAEYAVVRARNAYPVPDGVSAPVAALAEPLGCALHGIERSEIRPGGAVTVFGGGAVGLMLALLARRVGASRVLVVEPNPSRRALATRFGLNVTTPSESRIVAMEMSGGAGMDVVFDATGVPQAIEQALEITGRGGTLALFGVAAPDARLSIAPYAVYRDEISIKGMLLNAYTTRRALALLPQLDLAPLVTHTFPLSEIAAAFAAVSEQQGVKVQFAPQLAGRG